MNRIDIALDEDFPGCRSWLDSDTWRKIVSDGLEDEEPGPFLARVLFHCRRIGAPEFLPDLARLEWHIRKIRQQEPPLLNRYGWAINPSLYLLEFHRKNLTACLSSKDGEGPESGHEFIIVWRRPGSGDVCARAASEEDLLMLKMISEGIDRREIAKIGALPVAAVDGAMERAAAKGILLAPVSRIRRDPRVGGRPPFDAERFLASPAFTLQWHITQACDLHCRHCYDRSDRSTLALRQAMRILDDLEDFCRNRHVKGQVSFTGGNPLLHPDFSAIYKSAAERGFTLAILGNPASREQLEELVSIRMPDFFQVSLEGRPEYNDFIRGKGHFQRVMDFLVLLRELGIYAMVMLTLTKDNIGQVLPLGERLKGKANVLHFNRLSPVGEGAALRLPEKEEYIAFLKEYLAASRQNPILGIKDNLINILMHQEGAEPFGGCTGYGCGAAFNFLALLADGEVHACRKFPSAVGNALVQTLEAIYESDAARHYRSGCEECGPCPLRPVCGGCLALARSHGGNVFKEKDPFCFLLP